MEISKLKLELYDLAAIILPGIFLMAEIVALISGFPRLVLYARAISGVELTLIMLSAFALGNLVQEAGDRVVKRFTNRRVFRQARDRFWESELRKDVCSKIVQLGGPAGISVDAAFDFCLTCLGGTFAKRDIFLAISDLSRSLWLLSLLGILPLVRNVISAQGWKTRAMWGAEGAAVILVTAGLSWSRMVRFRELSESPVFHSFLAQTATSNKKEDVGSQSEDD